MKKDQWELNPARMLVTVVLGVLLVISCVVLFGCGSSKHVTTEKRSEQSSQSQVIDSITASNQVLQAENSRLKRELETSTVKFRDPVPCPPIPVIDVPPACDSASWAGVITELNKVISQLQARERASQNKIQKLADGSVIYEGQIESLTDQREKVEFEANKLHSENLQLKAYKDSVISAQSKQETNSERKVKRPGMWVSLLLGWVFIAIGWGLRWYAEKRRWI